MFGLMTRREHEDLMLSMESEQVYLKQKVETICERIQLGEEYRARLETEITSLKGKNRELVQKLESAKAEVEEKLAEIERLNMKIREQQLMLGSFEANWAARNEKAAGEEETVQHEWRSFVPKTKKYPPMPVPEIDEEQATPIPRRAPLARDERRREAGA